MSDYSSGGFTLPGEAGYESLTLERARQWGADVIRDSDGTKLSPEIVKAGSFLAWRIREEINMYNHTTNHWQSEHLRQLDPRHPLAWEYLQGWLRAWCEKNPGTNVVRLTSLFYNFVWIFGSDLRRRTRFVDWASYDFTVSPAALRAFEREYGYALTAEDFINRGKLQATHRPPTARKRDYMDFIQRFVAEKARALVEIIHSFGKEAYVFYDDSWVGMEPYGKYFSSIGFDGLIKCVFSGFECRLCAGAEVPVHELRFHPYLFPVGLGGLPTFSEGGHPEKDAEEYWLHVRRALARQCVDRIGLGGYLHLTVGQDAFNEAVAGMAKAFRHLKELHALGAPAELPVTVAVLHAWGALRSWTLSGHFHETDWNPLIHVSEALSGLPVRVRFICFDDVKNGALRDADVLINAGHRADMPPFPGQHQYGKIRRQFIVPVFQHRMLGARHQFFPPSLPLFCSLSARLRTNHVFPAHPDPTGRKDAAVSGVSSSSGRKSSESMYS
ncbi:MAG: hypothetical protein IKQ45_05330 [Clostridia bacterium]|nr:hypothetical protein [Clostridia bacterium]